MACGVGFRAGTGGRTRSLKLQSGARALLWSLLVEELIYNSLVEVVRYALADSVHHCHAQVLELKGVAMWEHFGGVEHRCDS